MILLSARCANVYTLPVSGPGFKYRAKAPGRMRVICPIFPANCWIYLSSCLLFSRIVRFINFAVLKIGQLTLISGKPFFSQYQQNSCSQGNYLLAAYVLEDTNTKEEEERKASNYFLFPIRISPGLLLPNFTFSQTRMERKTKTYERL